MNIFFPIMITAFIFNFNCERMRKRRHNVKCNFFIVSRSCTRRFVDHIDLYKHSSCNGTRTVVASLLFIVLVYGHDRLSRDAGNRGCYGNATLHLVLRPSSSTCSDHPKNMPCLSFFYL